MKSNIFYLPLRQRAEFAAVVRSRANAAPIHAELRGIIPL